MALERTRPDGHGRARGLVSSRTSGRRIDSHGYAPPAALAPVVELFWSSAWDLRGQAPHVVEMITDPCVQLVFEARASRVVGVTTRLFRRELTGRGSIRAAKLKAGAALAVLPVPSLAALTDQIVPMSSLFPALARAERAVLTGDDGAGFAALERWLSARLRPPTPAMQLAIGVIDRVARDRHVTTVEQVCRIAGLSIRPLQRLFRDIVGVSPKWVLRRERLRDAAVALERGQGPSLAELAAELGYADHAHLTRDFKRATGRTPSAFAQEVWR